MNYYIPKVEPGLKNKKRLHFYESSDIAKKIYYYALWGGDYTVDVPYSIERDYMNSFILFWIQSGTIHFHYMDQSFSASANEIVLLDCKEKHHYYVKGETNFQFLHFSGKQAQEFYNELYNKNGCVFTLPCQKNNIPTILSLIESNHENDFNISLLLYEQLGNLLESSRKGYEHRDANLLKKPQEIQAALTYIHENYASKLSVEVLSNISNLSTYHFSRTFKKYVGTSPHQYLLNYRLIQAKNLLIETNLSIEEISIECGFYSIAHFIKAFSKSTEGLTPGKFRKLHF